MQLALASDHAGFDLKEELAAFLAGLGHTVENLGTHSKDPGGLSRFGPSGG